MTIQDVREVYATTRYSDKLGIQGYYDTLIDHAQNMLVYCHEPILLLTENLRKTAGTRRKTRRKTT